MLEKSLNVNALPKGLAFSYAWLMLRFLIIFLFCTGAYGTETGYRYVHPDGTVEFSDEPIPGGEPIQLREAPTTQFAPATPSPSRKSTTQGSKTRKEKKAANAGISIISPKNNQTFRYSASGVAVGVRIDPPLKDEEIIQITMDGKLVASGTGNSFQVDEVYRGTHTLQATVIGESGSVQSRSTSVTIHMKQHSVIDRKPATEQPQPSGPEPILPE